MEKLFKFEHGFGVKKVSTFEGILMPRILLKFERVYRNGRAFDL